MEAVGRAGGLTIPELLAVLAIVAILASLATPGFRELRRSAALSASVNQMVGALHFARSAAILRGIPTVFCLSADGARCMERGDTPARGWLVFHDSQPGWDVQMGSGYELLRVHRLPRGLDATGTRTAVTFWPVSRAGTTSTFTICPADRSHHGRAIVVSRTGRPRVAQGEDACRP